MFKYTITDNHGRLVRAGSRNTVGECYAMFVALVYEHQPDYARYVAHKARKFGIAGIIKTCAGFDGVSEWGYRIAFERVSGGCHV